MSEREPQFLKPEEKKEEGPEIENERVEIGGYSLEPVDREANKFHFLQNLTEWHHSVSETDNKIWEKEVGGFSEEEKKTIGDFKVIIEKYGEWSDKGLISIFTNSVSQEEREKRLKESVSPDDKAVIERSLKAIESPFSKIWGKNEEKLLKTRQKFIKKLENFEKSGKKEELEGDLSAFFGSSNKPDKLKVFFLMQETGSGGDAPLWGDAVSLRGFSPRLSVFYHELAHKIWEESSTTYQKNTEDAVGSIKRRDLQDFKRIGLHEGRGHLIINEAVMGSLLPNGCLSKFFPEETPLSAAERKSALENLLVNKKDVKSPTGEKVIFNQVMANRDMARSLYLDFLSMNLVPLSERYIQGGRKAGKAYFREAVKTIISSAKRVKVF